jgi:DNA-directed RNA polymerase subunit E'/Rpb7
MIYKGRIVKIVDFGFFVKITENLVFSKLDSHKREGLVHVSQIRSSGKMGMRLEKAQDSGFEEKDDVFVKLT